MQRLQQTFTFTAKLANCAGVTSVRTKWCRKPIALGTAKSKIFRVAPRIVLPVEEEEEIRRLYNNYRTQMKSLTAYLTEKYCVSNLKSLDPEEIKRQFEEDYTQCKKINDEWNEQQRIVREKQAAERLAEEIEFAKAKIAEHEEQRRNKLEQIEELVRYEKESAKDFILDLETLDIAIERALANAPVDHNFAIDLEGNRIYGKQNKELNKEAVKQ